VSGFRTTVYLDDEVQARARALGINTSEVCQRALAIAVDARIEELRREVVAADEAKALLLRLDTATVSIGESAAA
jgi:post-segregation antitoxin (ccd killing protein)